MKLALRPLREVHGRTYVEKFGPLALKAVREQMVRSGTLSRQVINRRVNRMRRMFKWAVSEELCPKSTYEGLRAVEPLKQGRTTAHEAPPIEAVPQAFVAPVVEVASPQIAAMVQLQQLGAMRPIEVTVMRARDIDMTRDIWLYQPHEHKNRWRGKDRAPIFLGRQAQEVIRPFLSLSTDSFLFSPIEAEKWRNAERRKNRKSPMTDIRKTYGIEAAQIFLGHEEANVTQVYAERDLEVGIRIARELG